MRRVCVCVRACVEASTMASKPPPPPPSFALSPSPISRSQDIYVRFRSYLSSPLTSCPSSSPFILPPSLPASLPPPSSPLPPSIPNVGREGMRCSRCSGGRPDDLSRRTQFVFAGRSALG
eukprot:GHVU01012570.1.p1 GENE.GHVU01012570.1~~GHVU01012570.1.p1  ORF type:complete len:120 (+),score=12.83 GHVU01012570.1:319-678(+)